MKDIIANFLGEWCVGFNVWGLVFKVAIIVVMSAIVGCERATKRHAAGLRTFMLVSLISMLAAVVDSYIIGTLVRNFHLQSARRLSGLRLSVRTLFYIVRKVS